MEQSAALAQRAATANANESRLQAESLAALDRGVASDVEAASAAERAALEWGLVRVQSEVLVMCAALSEADEEGAAYWLEVTPSPPSQTQPI